LEEIARIQLANLPESLSSEPIRVNRPLRAWQLFGQAPWNWPARAARPSGIAILPRGLEIERSLGPNLGDSPK
jgi:hypothetical protein